MAGTASGGSKQTQQDGPIYPIGNGVKPPQPISTPEPDFGPDAARMKFHGVVVVGGYIGTDGKFHDAKVLQSIADAIVDAKVLGAVKGWKFRPCTKEGQPVNCTFKVEVAIRLN